MRTGHVSQFGRFYKNEGFGRVSDCEGLVGGQPQEIVSVPFVKLNGTKLAQNFPRAVQIREVTYAMNLRADRHLYGHLIICLVRTCQLRVV